MPFATTSVPRLWKTLLRFLCHSWKHAVRFIKYILKHPQGGELIRFLFLGTVMETARSLTQKIPEYVNGFFRVKAHFQRDSVTYNWVTSYLEHHQVWHRSRTFNVAAQNADKIMDRDPRFKSGDGYLDAVYEPVPNSYDPSPDLFHWKKRHWITVSVDTSALMLEVWSLNQNVLDDFIQEAREFYLKRSVPPPEIIGSDSLLVAGTFESDDISYTWILEYLQSQNIMTDVVEFNFSTQQSAAGWSPKGKKETIHALPSSSSVHRFRWRSHWVQVNLYRDSQITIRFHSCDKSVLLDFIEAARLKYNEAAISRVNVHLTDGYANWGRVVPKSRRSFSTLILPDGIKETLLADIQEFTDNEQWYAFAGVPHRRGYLLYGDPGTGKSTTVHALAGELGMEIYFVSLASPGVNNHTLGELFHSTPSHSILLIEDIDCAFPLRGDLSDEVASRDVYGETEIAERRSEVTLAGLLNILDSVVSQEGRILIATTNHIDQLDPALIRPGRIDVKIKYSLAVDAQLENVFHRFYPGDKDPANPSGFQSGGGLTVSELEALAHEFAAAIPHSKYSIAQLQGYLLAWKNNPRGAVQGIPAWIAQQEMEAAQAVRRGRREVNPSVGGDTADTVHGGDD